MRKNSMKSVLLTVVLLLMTIVTRAQVFIMDDEFEGNMRLGDGEYVLVAPIEGLDSDEFLYVPLDCGWLLLTGFGAAYMLSRRKKEEQGE